VKGDENWPEALAEMCEFASASAVGELTSTARASCGRARDIRPSSLLALAHYSGPIDKRSWKALEAMLEADPRFAPAALEYLTWFRYDNQQRQAFWRRVEEVGRDAQRSAAAQMLGYSRVLNSFGWDIKLEIYQHYFNWLRKHSHLESAWLVLAGGLSLGTPTVWPESNSATYGFVPDIIPTKAADYPPNEATHSASLALALAIYRARPNDYRSLWMMGFALERYGWMLRGNHLWRDVPDIGKRGFPIFVEWADRFNVAALHLHPEADTVWHSHMNTVKLGGGDWISVFDRAVEVNPQNARLYEDAMRFTLPQWGSDPDTRRRIAAIATAKNPDAQWAKTLLERYDEQARQFRP